MSGPAVWYISPSDTAICEVQLSEQPSNEWNNRYIEIRSLLQTGRYRTYSCAAPQNCLYCVNYSDEPDLPLNGVADTFLSRLMLPQHTGHFRGWAVIWRCKKATLTEIERMPPGKAGNKNHLLTDLVDMDTNPEQFVSHWRAVDQLYTHRGLGPEPFEGIEHLEEDHSEQA